MVKNMLTFACKKIRIEDIIRCSFELNKTEYKTLFFLINNSKKYTVSSIANKMGLNRTTVQKTTKKLLEKKLINKIQINLDKGGYEFYYNMKNKEEFKEGIKEILNKWVVVAEKEINKL